MSVIQKVLNCCIHVSTLCQSNSNSRIHNLDTYNISYMQLGYSCGSITVKIIVTRINLQLSPMYCIRSCNKSSPTGTTWEPDCGLDFSFCLCILVFVVVRVPLGFTVVFSFCLFLELLVVVWVLRPLHTG